VVVAAVLLAPATAAWAGPQTGHVAAGRTEPSAWAAVRHTVTAGWEALVMLLGPLPTTPLSFGVADGTAGVPTECSACGEPLPNAGVIIDPDG
jgi:hypothetical protein